MATFSRKVDITWTGNLMEGKGEMKAGTGAFSLPVTFPKRIGEPEGATSPEELIAGAHATCYGMGLVATIGKKGGSTKKVTVTCTVTGEKSDQGIKITTSKLSAVVEGLEGLNASDLQTTAKEAESRCPVSNAMRGNVNIDVDATAK